MDYEFGCYQKMASCLGLCLIGGYTSVPATVWAVGLSPVGPVSGGVFAWAQASGLVTAGSWWATAQSVAMGGMPGLVTGISTATSLACASTCPKLTGCSLEDFCK